MTCIKTGARVHFVNYGQVLAADLYRVNDAIVIRVLRPGSLELNLGTTIQLEHATHAVVAPAGGQNEFWRDDLGVFVVPEDCITQL